MKKFLLLFVTVLCLASCHNLRSKPLDNTSQLALRQIQTQYFETNDKRKVLEAVIAALQDQGYVIDKASFALGSVSATKLNSYQMRMTVVATPKGEQQIAVRANAQYETEQVKNPRAYKEFFNTLEKNLFLAGHMEL